MKTHGRRGQWVASSRAVLVIASVLVVGGLALLALYKMSREISYQALVASLRSTPSRSIVLALIATAVSYAVLLGNDLSALRYARARPPLTVTMLASFCGYALGNAIGLGALSGGAVRYRVYAAVGLSPGQIARVTLFIAVAFGLGVAATAALGLVIGAEEIGPLFGLSSAALRGLGGLTLGLVAALLILCAAGRAPIRLGPMIVELPSHWLVLAQLIISMADVVAGAASLWVLLPAFGVDFIGFATIYAAAIGLGVLSHAPGGIGVFEATLLFVIGTHASLSAVAAALIAYRAIYFLLPFIFAVALLAGSEIRRSVVKNSRTER